MSKYNFKGIKKYGAQGILLAITSTAWGSFINIWGIRQVAAILLEWLVNWLANNGLMILNIAAIAVEGEWDQKDFDKAMDEALAKVENKNGVLTPEEKAAIDDEVIAQFRKFAILTKYNKLHNS